MRNDANITAEQAHAMLNYNPDTGEFRWKARTPAMFQGANPEIQCAMWNGQFAGKIAGTQMNAGYRQINIFYRIYLAHRLAILMTNGSWPASEIDHINGDRMDNRICNLRAASRSENMQNCKRRLDNRSGYVGVCWSKQYDKWHARIMAAGRRKHIGYFDSKEEACAAYLKAKAELHTFQPTPRGNVDDKAA